MSQFNWAEQHVIVTGGGGFLGSHLVDRLKTMNLASLFVVRSAEYDLREQAQVAALFADHPNTTLVVHLAANVGGIGYNMEYPGTIFYDNMIMGVNVMEYARRNNVQKVVEIGTICSYPKFTPTPFSEEDLWNGYPEETNAPYGLAKKMLIVQGQAYHQEYGFNSIHLLPTNLYGPRDNFTPGQAHVIPDVMRKMVDAKERKSPSIILFGDGSPTREFLHVRDAVDAMLLATEKYNDPDPVNIGSGTEISIRDLITLIAEVTGYEGELIWDTNKPNGQPRRKVGTDRAKERFGFESQVDFRTGLQEVYEWYMANR